MYNNPITDHLVVLDMDDGSVQIAILYNADHIKLTILKKEFCNE